MLTPFWYRCSPLVLPDIGSALARIVLADEVELPVRQTAGVILKKFMDRWWDVLGEGLSEEVRCESCCPCHPWAPLS